MIYYMHGKTFIKKYIKEEDPKDIMKTNFILISSSIRKTGKYSKQVIIANNDLFPSTDLIMDFDTYKEEAYVSAYWEQMKKAIKLLGILIKFSLKGKNVVLLCGYNERKYNYLEMISEFIHDYFGYSVIDYKNKDKYKNNIDDKKVKKILNQVLGSKKELLKKELIDNDKKRDKYLKSLTRKEMTNMLKQEKVYVPDLTLEQMRDYVDIFILG